MVAKKLLLEDEKFVSWVLYVKFRIEKHGLVKYFAFLKNVCCQYLNLCFEKLTGFFYCCFFFSPAADWPTTNFLGMYCYFPVIRLVNFVAPVTVVGL